MSCQISAIGKINQLDINLETLSVLFCKVVSIEQVMAATCNFHNSAVQSRLVQALQEHWAMHDDQNIFSRDTCARRFL